MSDHKQNFACHIAVLVVKLKQNEAIWSPTSERKQNTSNMTKIVFRLTKLPRFQVSVAEKTSEDVGQAKFKM